MKPFGIHDLRIIMHTPATLDPAGAPAKRDDLSRQSVSAAALAALMALTAASPSARAVDGCTVLLCLAAPKWSAVPPCVPPIRQLFHDLARGRRFPACRMSSGSSSTPSNTQASNAWAHAPTLCPPQYTHLLDVDPGPVYSCDYTGTVSVVINGSLFARTWWNTAGQTVTEFTPAAKTQLGTWDSQFDDDYAAWLAAQPAPAPTPGDPH
jgi:hypothetical protein